MTMPAANEPAFIVNSSLCADDENPCKASSSPSLESRSTSPGSSSPLPSTPEAREIEHGGLPDFDYPVPFFVRNTFIEAGVPRPLSLEEFFEERRVHSCP